MNYGEQTGSADLLIGSMGSIHYCTTWVKCACESTFKTLANSTIQHAGNGEVHCSAQSTSFSSLRTRRSAAASSYTRGQSALNLRDGLSKGANRYRLRCAKATSGLATTSLVRGSGLMVESLPKKLRVSISSIIR